MNLYHFALCIEYIDNHMAFVCRLVYLCPSLCLGANDATRTTNKLYNALQKPCDNPSDDMEKLTKRFLYATLSSVNT